MKKLARSCAFILLATISVFSFGTAADAGSHSGKKVVYFDYNYTPHFKPSHIFLTANSGPYLKKLRWQGWGTSKSVGRGRFISDCASCGDYENRAVTVTFHKLVTCRYAPNVQIYRYSLIHVKQSTRRRTLQWNGNCPSKGWRQYN